MIRLVFSPKWFFGVDILFEIFFVFIALLISFYGYRIFRISKNREHKYFSLSFFLIAISFVFKVLTNFDIYYNVFKTLRVGSATVTFSYLYNSGMLHIAGLFLFKLFMTAAFFILFLLTDRKHSRKDIYLILYLILVSTFFSISTYYVFHITLAIILFFISKHFFENYEKSPKTNRLMVFLSFSMLFLSQFAFMMVFVAAEFYVIGEIVMLVGYSILLYNLLAVARK